jgi:hypothetical protein
MRLAIYGDHDCALALREMFSHPTINWNTKSWYPTCKVIISRIETEALEIECHDGELRRLILEQLEEQGFTKVTLKLGATKGLDISIGIPVLNASEEENKRMEIAVFRALLFRAKTRTKDFVKILRDLSLPVTLLLVLATQAFGKGF